MNAVIDSALNTYARLEVETGVSGATPEMLILMLYDGAIREVTMAQLSLERDEVTAKARHVHKAYRIIEEGLRCALDTAAGGDIARNLGDLYDYMCQRLTLANTRNDADALAEVERLLVELREAWGTLVSRQARLTPAPAETDGRRESSSYGRV